MSPDTIHESNNKNESKIININDESAHVSECHERCKANIETIYLESLDVCR